MVTEGAETNSNKNGLQSAIPSDSAVLLNSRNSLVIFGAAFAYTFVVAVAIEKFVLPVLLPQLHAGHGLMVGHDSVSFHAMADEMATRIRTHGWNEWKLIPNLQGVVGISAAIYALTGVHEPIILVPIYSALYALSVTCVYRIVLLLTGSESGALSAAAAFLFFPSAAMIYADLHKDAWSCAGLLLLIAAWVETETRERATLVHLVCLIIACCLALSLIWVVRPYLIKLALGGFLLGWLTLMLSNVVLGNNWRREWKRSIGYVVVLTVMATISVSSSAPLMESSVAPPTFIVKPNDAKRADAKGAANQTLLSSHNPLILHTIGAILSVRQGVLNTPGGSILDKDVRFPSFMHFVFYVPRALQIGLFAPFPDMWFERGMTAGSRLMRLVSGAEMSIAYVLLLGFFFLIPSIRRDRIVPFLFVIVTCIAVVEVMSLTMPNIGALYRMRYPMFMLVVGLGAAGWAILLAKIRARNKPA